jgi:hypothetical protein
MEIQIYDVAVVAVIIGIVEIAKRAGLNTNWCPLLSLALGVTAGVLFLSDGDIKKGIVIGIACGLSASGLYDNAKLPMTKE